MIKAFCTLLSVLLLAAVGVNAVTVPSDRLITWDPGVRGGIINRSTIQATIQPTCSPNCAGTINAAIDAAVAAGGDKVVKLAAGTFALGQNPIVLKSNVTLRGNGSGATGTAVSSQTIITGGANDMVLMKTTGADTEWCFGTQKNLTSTGLTKGSSTIHTAAAHGRSVGDPIMIDVLPSLSDDPPTAMSRTEGRLRDGGALSCGPGTGPVCYGQWAKVTAVPDSTTLTIDPPLYRNYDIARTPQIYPVIGHVDFAGIEDITFDNSVNQQLNVLELDYPINCWVTRCEIRSIYRDGIKFYGGLWTTIFKNWVHGGVPEFPTNPPPYGPENGGYGTNRCYGIFMGPGNTSCLIENNVFNRLTTSMTWEGSCAGNVYAYNAIEEVAWWDTHVGHMAVLNHGGVSINNLVEGNWMGGRFGIDGYFGTGEHFLVFRNRIQQQHDSGKTDQTWTMDIDWHNWYNSFVGNIIGTPGWETLLETYGEDDGHGNVVSVPTGLDTYSGDKLIWRMGFTPIGGLCGGAACDPNVRPKLYRHGNWDSINNGQTWEASNADHTMPSTYYLSGTPSWFNSLHYPPYDPANPLISSINDIPAGYRYTHANADPPGGAPTPTPTPTATPSPPVVQTHPQSITINEGQTPTFSITINSGAGQVSYQWQKNNVNFVRHPASGTTGAVIDALVAPDSPPAVLADDGSTWRCIVTNVGGSVTSNSATLTVNGAPPPCPAGGFTHAVGTWSVTEGEIIGPFTVTDAAEDYISQTVQTIDPSAGGKARYCVTIPNPANATGYKLSMKVDTRHDLGSDSLFVNFDAEPDTNLNLWAPIPATAVDVPEFRDVFFYPPGPAGNPYIWMLTPGVHQLILRGREADLRISQIKIEANANPSPTPTPSPTPPASVPIITPNGGSFTTSQVVTMDSLMRTGSPVIKFTVNGIDPAIADPGDIITYNGINYTVDHSLRINARTSATGFLDSALTTTLPYMIAVATPSASPGAGTYTGMTTQTLTCSTPNSVQFYSIDGSTPSVPYGTPIVINSSCTLKYRATKIGLDDSPVGSSIITITAPSPTPTPTPTPSATPTPTVTPFPPVGGGWID